LYFLFIVFKYCRSVYCPCDVFFFKRMKLLGIYKHNANACNFCDWMPKGLCVTMKFVTNTKKSSPILPIFYLLHNIIPWTYRGNKILISYTYLMTKLDNLLSYTMYVLISFSSSIANRFANSRKYNPKYSCINLEKVTL
jgi:hypothetical protein